MNHPHEKMDELIACYNEAGNPIEPHTRAEVHSEPLRYWHATSEVWVVNRNAELLCSKRSPLLTQGPGRWQTRFGGHVNAGDTFEQTAVRELEEEAGIKISENDLVKIGGLRREINYKHLGKCYVYLFNGDLQDIKFNDGEVTDIKWMRMEDYWKEQTDNPGGWRNGCSLEDQKLIKDWLKTHV